MRRNKNDLKTAAAFLSVIDPEILYIIVSQEFWRLDG